jgi:hypothetical protein
MLLSLVALAAVGTAASGAHWIPFAWRGWDPWIARVAKQCKNAGISVQSTLICQETGMATREGYRIPQQLAAPDFRFLSEELQDEWRGITAFAPRWMTVLWKRHPEFVRKLAGALHEAGVPVMAGTDALGAPFIIPGISLHREMQLLAESGFSPREILESATIVPARFLGREAEFGTITVGKRADLLLVEGNPLEDLDRLRRPVGVMVRGIWQYR